MQVISPSGHRISLRKLLPDAEFFGADDILVDACCCDAEQVEPGSLYIALAQPNHDGHEDAPEAVARGCAAVLAERPVPGLSVPMCFVADAREAYGRLCQALTDHPSRRLKAIAVAGGRGRTVTSCLIASVLSKAGHQVGLLGELGACDGHKVDAGVRGTPPADQLALWLNRMVVNGCSHAIIEVSHDGLDESRIAGVTIDAACVAPMHRASPDDPRRLDDCRLTKSKLLKHLGPDGLVVLNADDPVAVKYLGLLDGPVLTVGMNTAAEITGMMLERSLSEETFLLVAGDEGIPVQTRRIGSEHVYGCLTAAAIGLAYGLDLPTIARGLEAVDYVPGHLQRLECGQPFGVFVDGARSPESVAAALETLREVKTGRLICVIGAEGDGDEALRPALGRAVEDAADRVVLTSDNPGGEDPREIVEDILAGFRVPKKAIVVLDRAKAIFKALSAAKPGDCVLIAGKGCEAWQATGSQDFELDDCEVAKDWLYTTGAKKWAA